MKLQGLVGKIFSQKIGKSIRKSITESNLKTCSIICSLSFKFIKTKHLAKLKQKYFSFFSFFQHWIKLCWVYTFTSKRSFSVYFMTHSFYCCNIFLSSLEACKAAYFCKKQNGAIRYLLPKFFAIICMLSKLGCEKCNN